MKKLLKISFLLAVLCLAIPAYAEDGDIPTGNKPCTQNCTGGFYNGTTVKTTGSDETKTNGACQDDSKIDEIYSWIYEQISELIS
jgi:hypothetical protein